MSKLIAYLCIGSALVLIAAVNLHVLGAGQAGTEKPLRVKDTWRVAIPVKVPTLNPQELLSVSEKSISLLAFSRLVSMDEHSDIQADALESWTYDLTLNRYYFKIREGVRFHDGRPLNADDVIFSFHQWARKEALDNDLLAPIRGAREYSAGRAPQISGIARVNAMTVSVDLEEWVDHFIKNLSNPRFCLFPNNFGGLPRAKYFEKPVGSGPYKVVSYTPEVIRYEANSRYHGGGPITPRVEVRYEPFEQARVSFNARVIDDLIMYDVSNTEGLDVSDVNLERFRSFSTFAVVLNGNAPALRKKSVRHTVAGLIDKERIIRNCYAGATAAKTLIPPGMVGSSVREAEDRDEPETREKLSALDLYIPEDLNAGCLRDVLIEELQGTPIKVKVVSFREMYELLKAGKLAMWLESFEFKSEDPIGVLQYFSETSNEFLLGMHLPDLQAKYRKLGKGLTSNDRAGIYREIDDYMVQNHHVIPVFYPSSYGVFRKSLKGIHNLRTWRYVADWHRVYGVE